MYRGRLARLLACYLPNDRNMHLFDSFEGLPSDWVGSWKEGDFALNDKEIPVFRQPNKKVYKGWFSETVPPFAQTLIEPLAFLHIDCDLYSSTRDVLTGMNAHIAPGTVLLFDEYMMRSEGKRDDGEHKELLKWCKNFDRRIDYLWRTHWMQSQSELCAKINPASQSNSSRCPQPIYHRVE